MYELMVSASSAREEEAWKSALHARTVFESSETLESQSSPHPLAALSLDIKAIGTLFGQPGTLARRISIHRATTVGAKTGISQVIIRNTHARRDGPDSNLPSTWQVNRSQSLVSAGRVPILTPRRSDKIHLEDLLSDVWTRDVIPYPSTSSRRGENLKASASSMMRKLSMASITSGFTKRSLSHASYADPGTEGSATLGEELPEEEYLDAGGEISWPEELYPGMESQVLNDMSNGIPSEEADSETIFRRSGTTRPLEVLEEVRSSIGFQDSAAEPAIQAEASPKRKTRPRKLVKMLSVDNIRKLFR